MILGFSNKMGGEDKQHEVQLIQNLLIASNTGHVTIFCPVIYIYLNTYTLRIVLEL